MNEMVQKSHHTGMVFVKDDSGRWRQWNCIIVQNREEKEKTHEQSAVYR